MNKIVSRCCLVVCQNVRLRRSSLAALMLLLACGTQFASGFQVLGGPGLNESNGSENKFRNLKKQIQKNEMDVSRLYSSIPIGFAEEQKAHLAKIAALKTETEVLRGQLNDAAMESFRAAPDDNPQAVRHVFEILSSKIDGTAKSGQLYDPVGALELANLMIKSGVDSPPVLYQAFRACFGIQDFQRADVFLEEIESAGEKMSSQIREQLEDAREKWQREAQQRSQEESANDLPRVKFVTDRGEFVVELFENQAPQTVANFIYLVENKFYDGLTFHLVRAAQFAQTGCPIGDGKGDPGYRIANETGHPDARKFFAGTIGMTHNGPGTAGSQFFISYQPNRAYDKDFVAFGRIIEGLNVLYSLKLADKTADIPSPGEPSKIVSATVLRKRNHDYDFERLVSPNAPIQTTSSDGDRSLIPDVAPDVAPQD